MQGYIAVMIIGAFGCAARMWLASYVSDKYSPTFPLGTLLVNIIGCFLIGLFASLTRPDGGFIVQPIVRQAVMIGFLGGFTTFSSFGLQTVALINDGEIWYATLNVLLSVFLCLIAVWIGQIIGVQLVRE